MSGSAIRKWRERPCFRLTTIPEDSSFARCTLAVETPSGNLDAFFEAAHSFTITLAATDQRTGRTGPGVATQMNDIFGYFSIPSITGNPSNPEVFVKILDGIGVNGRYWFFYGGLTDLEYTLTVTEDASGLTKTYTKVAGSACGGFDTEAFTP